ncbi:hypothetical protein [Dietzia natronolimnaea]|uniref:hypothetical protein n=1 Tax=Dietzia natronolimnaea TaxID=161920 RepID=UPI001FEA3AC7|nr:hypothetical protein [Dietzia natronolimnaea]
MREIDLPRPEKLAPRWSALAAVLAAYGPRWAESAYATDSTWHYDDGGGNWADIRFAGEGRAVLLGYDHEYSTTYFRAAAEYFGEPETDLLAGCPAWWAEAIGDYLERIDSEGMWIGFIYGFDGGTWTRAEYDDDDGFTSLNLPALDDRAVLPQITGQLTMSIGGRPAGAAPDPALLDRVLAECPDLSADTARALLGGRGLDVDAALRAAHQFRQRG